MTDATSETSPPRMDRAITAILVATVFVLTTVPALFFLGWSRFDSFPMPFTYWGGSVRFQDEIIGHCIAYDQRSVFTFTIDLHSRKTRFENFTLSGRMGLLASSDNRLWTVSMEAVTVTDGLTEERYTPQKAWVSPISGFFLYENRPAIVDMDDSHMKYHLYVFHDGDWQDRGEIGVPGAGRTWIKNELTGIDEMQPSLSDARQITPGSQHLEVVEVADVCHLFFSDTDRRLNPGDARITAYRQGFDFLDQFNEASAIAPENVPADTVGWSLLGLKFGLRASAVDRDTIVRVLHQNPSHSIQFWEPSPKAAGQQFEVVTELNAANRWENLELFNAPDGNGLYFIRYRPILPQFYRYQNRELHQIPPPWDTDLTRMVQWAEPVILRLAAIYAIGLLFLVTCAEWLSRARDDRFGFGATHVRIAAIWRRCLARAIDLTLILACAGFYAIQLGPDQIAAGLYEFWDATNSAVGGNSFDSSAGSQFVQLPVGYAGIQSSIWAAVVFFILLGTQSVWGVTPGKWLCRLRVLRTTLRPCGFARSLLREVLLVADAPLLLTILPAIMAMLTTDHRQRLGDLAADTIVVDSGPV